MSLTHSAVLRDRKKVQDAFLAVNAALRARTDAVYDLLAAVKDTLKGQPAYDEAFEALKATLTPEALDNPQTMAEAETALGRVLVPLVVAIRADESLRAKPESQAAFAKLTVADAQIHERPRHLLLLLLLDLHIEIRMPGPKRCGSARGCGG